MGIIIILPSILSLVPFYNSDEETVGVIVAIITIIQGILLPLYAIPTEMALKKKFSD